MLWNAYNSLKGKWPDVLSVDKMEVFGRTSLPTSEMMNDTLHPNNTGQRLACWAMFPQIFPPPLPINLAASAAAWEANPAKPWTVYPRALEDTRYATLVRKVNVYSFGSGGWLDFGSRWNDASGFTPDIVKADEHLWTPQGVYTFNGFEGKSDMGGGVRIYGFSAEDIPFNPMGNARIYRRLPA